MLFRRNDRFETKAAKYIDFILVSVRMEFDWHDAIKFSAGRNFPT